MSPAFGILITLAAFITMEGVAWTVHKYVMHGWLWSLHEDHHIPEKRGLERNDWFAVFFAAPAILLFVAGLQFPPAHWAAIGVTLYGAVYFGFHDIIVHRRLRVPFKIRQPYLRHIIKAHRFHHAVREKNGAVSFGFLIAPSISHLKQKLRRSSAG